MSASTLRVILRAREFLRRRSGSLVVQPASAPARRVVEICRAKDLLGAGPKDLTSEAPRSWVAVPEAEQSDGQPRPSAPLPSRVPVPVGRARTLALQEWSASDQGTGYEPREQRLGVGTKLSG
jgi:hypothetical protein